MPGDTGQRITTLQSSERIFTKASLGLLQEGEAERVEELREGTSPTGGNSNARSDLRSHTEANKEDPTNIEQNGNDHPERRSAQRKYADRLMVTWKRYSVSLTGEALDLNTTLPEVAGWREEVANNKEGDCQEAERWWKATAQKMAAIFKETCRLRAHLTDQEIQVIFGSRHELKTSWQWKHTRFSVWYNKAMKEYIYADARCQLRKVKRGITNWGMAAWRWLVGGEKPGAMGERIYTHWTMRKSSQWKEFKKGSGSERGDIKIPPSVLARPHGQLLSMR